MLTARRWKWRNICGGPLVDEYKRLHQEMDAGVPGATLKGECGFYWALHGFDPTC